MAELRSYSLVSLSGAAWSMLEGRAHLTVPVVAMVGGAVVMGMNSKGPEYVPPEVLASFPQGLDQRPCVLYHPEKGNGSALTPECISTMRMGQCFGSFFDLGDACLKTSAWLDLDRCTALGSEHQSIMARAEAGEMIEVSLGAYIEMDAEDGVSPDGIPYSYVWRTILSYDHLAIGLIRQGEVGACSLEMGCGANR
jgi:hypothetical protein